MARRKAAANANPKANFKNRTLFRGDNLDFLRALNSETVDLIATDPPFNKGRDFHATPDSLAKGAEFQDRWRWEEDVHEEWIDQIQDDYLPVWSVIDYTRQINESMAAFLCFMAVRLIEMRRVLKDTGSIYLHCDQTASHYLKALMDAIFGIKNFRNEIVWKRSASGAKGSQHASKRYGRNTDSILYYTVSDAGIFHAPHIKPEDNEARFPCRDGRGRYNTSTPLFCAPSMGARPNLCYEYKGVRNPHPSGWRVSKKRLREMDKNGEIIWREGKRPLRKTYEDEYKGEPLGNLWVDVPNVMGRAKEATGYPTQKPLALYRRIILASTNPGDVVLDPFCGCATTVVAAEIPVEKESGNERQWIGMDYWEDAYDVVVKRLKEHNMGKTRQLSFYPKNVHEVTAPPKRTDDRETVVPLKTITRTVEPTKKKKEIKRQLIEERGVECWGCMRGFDGDERYLEVDHVNPVAAAGRDAIENRALLCGPCNKIKRDKLTLIGLIDENRKLGHITRENAMHLKNRLRRLR